MKIIKARDFDASAHVVNDVKTSAGIEKTVEAIIKDVRENGDAALLVYAEKFDGARLSSLTVSSEEIDEAMAATDPYFLETLRIAAENITLYHKNQIRTDFALTRKDGAVLGQRIIPIEKAGVYVPGGTASYPSTVLMDVIPAKLAGVSEIVMTTPPGRDGKIAKEILAAAKVAGVTRIIKSGGAQAIAALAYGTESVPAVDKIVGPGNIYVATAKRMVFGVVSIDMIAGPSEILVVADSNADPECVAADLLSQAEHDRLAGATLITPDEKLASAVSEQVELQLSRLPREKIARESIESNGRIIISDTLAEAVEIANNIAPEHLELAVDDPFSFLPLVRNAGCVFLGHNVPEALGDYMAGTNHTLPTSGTARFSSPLSVDDFIKKTSFVYFSGDAFRAVGDRVADFAHREGLDGHANSVLVRMKKRDGN